MRKRHIVSKWAISGSMALLTAVATIVVGPSPAWADLAPPASVTAIPGRRLVVVNWTPPESGEVHHYVASVGGTPCSKATTPLTCTFSNLVANTVYTATVKACPDDSGNGCSELASASPVIPGPPRTPAKPGVAYYENPNTVRVTWAAPPGDEDDFIASYRVTPTPSAGLTGSCMTLVTSRACDFEGLESGTSYTFRVVANGITTGTVTTGTSVASSASDAIVAGPPGMPRNVVATFVSPVSLTVTWDEPDSGAPVGRYRVMTDGQVEASEIEACGMDPDERSCTFTNLDPGTPYTFQVAAEGESEDESGGTSDPSVASTPIKPGAPGVPGTPIAELGNAEGEVMVTWEPPSDGADPTSYTVTPHPATGDVLGTPAEDCADDLGAPSCVFTGLAPGVPYTFVVRAITGVDWKDSAPSDPVVSEAPAKPAKPQVVLGDAPGKVTVTWAPPISGGAVNSYAVTAIPGGGGATGTQTAGCGFNLAAPSCSFISLDRTKSYTFVVTAIGDLGSRDSDPSEPVVPDAPGKSSKPTVALVTDTPGAATVSWDKPTTGGVVTGYTVTALSDGGAAGTRATACTTPLLASMTCSITGLTASKSYTFVVRSVGVAGGTNSDPSDAVVPDAPGKSSKPSVALVGNTPGAVTVGWNKPTTGGAVTSYTVTAIPEGGGATGVRGENCGLPLGPSMTCSFTELNPLKSYTFVVRSIGVAGGTDSDPSDAVVSDAPGRSSKPSVVLVGNTPGAVTVTWNKPTTGGAVTSYTVTAIPEGGGATGTRDDNCGLPLGPSMTCSITELNPLKSYTFVVRSIGVAGGTDSDPSDVMTPDAPGKSSKPSVALVGNTPGAVTVSWDKPTTGGVVTGYTVTAVPEGGGATGTQAAGCGTPLGDHMTCSITALNPLKSYTFVVRSVGVAGGTNSDSSDAVVPDAPGKSSKPSVALVTDTPGAVTVSWNKPTTGGAVTSYTVTAIPEGGGATGVRGENCGLPLGPSMTCSFTELNPLKSYTFVVRSIGVAGGTNSDPSDAMTSDVPGKSSKPSVALVTDTPGAVTVTWNKPTTGGAVTSYTVTAIPGGGGATGTRDENCGLPLGPSMTCSITALNPLKSYTFVVRSIGVAGGTDSDPSTAVFPDRPGVPTAVAIEVSTTTPGSARVKWEPPATGGPATGYSVTVSPEPGTPPSSCSVGSTVRYCDFTGLSLSTQYTFVVRATGVSGNSDAVTLGPLLVNKPGAPGTPTVQVTAAGTVKVSWTAPTSGGQVDSYTVTSSASPTSAELCTNVTVLTCNFSGLEAGTSYTFLVTANGAAGGVPSANRSEAIRAAAPSAAGQPTVALAGPNAVKLTWAAADAGGPVTGYTVVSNPAVIAPVSCTDVLALSCVFDRLISGTSYTFTVVAKGPVTPASTSQSSVSIIPGPPDAPVRPTVALTGVGTQVRVTWVAPSVGAGIAGYAVQSNPGDHGCAVPAGAGDTSCVVSGLNSGTTYRFRVQALGVTGSGNSAFSPTSEPIVPGALGSPFDVEVAAGDRQIAVSWTAPGNSTGSVAYYLATANPGNATCRTDDGSSTECLITGLSNRTAYTVTVVAVGPDNSGNSAPSAPSIRVRPTAGAPGAPTGVKATPRDGGATIAWTAPAAVGDGIARYTATATGTPDGRTCVTPNETTLTCVITGLTNGSDYQITVVAVGKGASGISGPSSPAVTVRPRVVLPSPTNVQVTQGAASLSVQFTPVSPGDGVASYTATAAGGPSNGPCTTTNISTTPCVIKGVTPGTSYTVTVVAIGTNPNAYSLPSEPSSPVTAVASLAPTLPSAPPTTIYGGVTFLPSSTTMAVGAQVTVSGTAYAPYTGITVGLYQPTTVRTTWQTMTDSTGAFSLVVTIPGSNSGVTAGSATIVASGLNTAGTVRYRSSTVTLTVPVFSALARMASPVLRELPVADVRSRFTLAGAAR